MLTFKHYPPSRIPLRHWEYRIRNGKIRYAVIPTIWNWIIGRSNTQARDYYVRNNPRLEI